MTSEPGNHHQFFKLEKQAKNGGKKSFTSPAKATAFGVSSRQRFWARHPNRNELSNHTFFLGGAKSCSCHAIYLLSG